MPDDLIKEARELYDAAEQAEQDNRVEAMEDLRFRAGEQWEPDIRRARNLDGRPTLTINRIPQFVHQVTGNIRLNPPSIKVRPKGNGATREMAETYDGLLRDIQTSSDAMGVYLTAFDSAVTCGEGYFRIDTEYAEDDSWDLNIRLRRIPSPFAVLFDPAAADPCREDAGYCFVTDWIPQAQFKEAFPKASTSGFDVSLNGPHDWGDWVKDRNVRVCEYWCKVPMLRNIVRLADGYTQDTTGLEDSDMELLVSQHGEVTRERKVQGHKVVMHLMNGVEELEAPADWAGRFIPIIPVIGEEVHIGDRVSRHGLVRFARDPQRLYNIHRSALAESVAMAPKAKWLGTAKMFAGQERDWSKANTSNLAYLKYTPDPGAPQGPQRVAPDMPAAGLLHEIQLAASDLEETTGIHREELGQQTNAQSGKAILARQRRGDVGTYVYTDNLERALTYCGKQLIDLIPRIYDTERVIRTIGVDGTEGFVPINMTNPATGHKMNDLSVGTYDVSAEIGPSYATRREEERESMFNFFQAAPQAAQMAGDLFAEAMDWPDAEKIAKRLRKTLPPGMADPEPGDPPPAPPQPNPEMMAAQAQMALAQAEQMKAQAAAMKAQTDAQTRQAELQIEAKKLELEGLKLQLQYEVARAKAKDATDNTQIKGIAAASKVALDMHSRMTPPAMPQMPPNPLPLRS